MSGIFPPDIIAAAQAADRKWKVPASVSLAQWALESDWGTRNMGAANNCFGIKPWKASQPTTLQWTHEEVDGKSVRVQQKFCAFASIADCFDAHGEFLVRNSRYKPAFAAADSIAFARAIAKAGYATDSGYAGKLADLITRYGLMQFDVSQRIGLPRVPGPIDPPKKPASAAKAAAGVSAVVVAGSTAAAASGGPTGLWLTAGVAAIALVIFLVLHFRKKA